MTLCAAVAHACGAFNNDISYPLKFHFYQSEDSPVLSELQHRRNISSWQDITSTTIPPGDIAEAIYKLSLHSLQQEFDGQSDNAFINWIKDNDALYIRDFIFLAKEVEELRAQINSPWYYPDHKAEYVKPDDTESRLNDLMKVCADNTHNPLSDRYALQAIRILRSLNRPSDGILYYTNTLCRLLDANLMKQMAQGYVAGFHMNSGDTVKADKLFALAGDFNCLSSPTARNIRLLAFHNPESEVLKYRLNGFIGYEGRARNIRMLEIADAALRSPKVVNRGDWLYLKAFVEGVYNKNWMKAEQLAKEALANSFSDERMTNDARFFNICVTAKNGDIRNIDHDLSWMMDNYPNYRQGLLFFIIPALISNNQIDKALLFANTMDVDAPYASTGFQFLLSVHPDDVIGYKHKLAEAQGIFGKLKNKVRHDNDYLNDIIGTLYMRDGQYSKAIEYLKEISLQYQRNTNLFKGGYLAYNPWDYAYLPDSKWNHSWYKDTVHYWKSRNRPVANKQKVTLLLTQLNAKLIFAIKMNRLQTEIKDSSDSDTRNLAKLRYAIGRYNSFNTCWALTQYWYGAANQCNYQPWYYDNENINDLNYIIDTPKEMERIENWFVKEITMAMDALETDAAKATANMILRNYRTIAKYYSDSAEGKFLATHCDSWRDWL